MRYGTKLKQKLILISYKVTTTKTKLKLILSQRNEIKNNEQSRISYNIMVLKFVKKIKSIYLCIRFPIYLVMHPGTWHSSLIIQNINAGHFIDAYIFS